MYVEAKELSADKHRVYMYGAFRPILSVHENSKYPNFVDVSLDVSSYTFHKGYGVL